METAKTDRTNQNRFHRIVFLVATTTILATFANPAQAQVDASLAGTVRDVTGLAIPGATIHIESIETGKQRELHTDDAGRFRALALAVGQYDLTVDKAGFRSEHRTDVVLVVGQHEELDLTLKVGDVQQVVEVSADPVGLAATTEDTSGLVGERQSRPKTRGKTLESPKWSLHQGCFIAANQECTECDANYKEGTSHFVSFRSCLSFELKLV